MCGSRLKSKTEEKMDYTKLDGPGLLRELGRDAAKWAAAFCQIIPEGERDEEIMLVWFANAIMHTLDIDRGTLLNGEHAEYLLEHGLTPWGAPWA